MKCSGPIDDGERQADARPDRVAAADPVPEAEHAVGLDAEGGDLVELGRHRGEMIGDRRLRRARRRSRRARSAALVIVSWVVKVFEETMNSVRAGSSPRSVSAMSAPSTLETKCARRFGRREGRERPRRHRRAEVRAADADVDDVGHRLAERAAHPALAHVGGEGEHLRALGLDLGHDVGALDQHRLAGEIAQRACAARRGARSC